MSTQELTRVRVKMNELGGNKIKLVIWDSSGVTRFQATTDVRKQDSS